MNVELVLNGYCAGAPGVRCRLPIRRYGDPAWTLCPACYAHLDTWRRTQRAAKAAERPVER